MEKIKSLAPLLTLLAFLIKTILVPASIADALILFSLVGYVSVDQFRLRDKRLADLEAKLKQFQETQTHFQIEIDKAKSSVNSMKVGMGVRGIK